MITVSKYTTEIRFICESAVPLEEQGSGNNVDVAIESGRGVLFNFNYDLFDSNYKSVIETKFLRHNYVREIGFETVGLFKLRLQDEWLMKLPYYNKLWESALIEFNPIYDVDYKVSHQGQGTSNRNDSTTSNNERTTTDNITSNENLLDKYSDTPQGELNGVIDTDWLTNARQNVNTRSATSNGSIIDDGSGSLVSAINNTDAYIRSVVGKMPGKSYSKMLKEFRETFINIDEMFINEFKKLFMLIY